MSDTTAAVPSDSQTEGETSADALHTETTAPAADADSYFDGSLFIGDSVLEGISKYVRAQRNKGVKMLSDAKFLTNVTGIRIADLIGESTDETIRYMYKGKEQELTDIVSDIQPKRIFLFLGMNDLSDGASVEETIGRYERLIQLLQKEFPDVHLIVMTVTPKTNSQYLPWYCKNKEFGSPLLNGLSEALITFCTEKQIDYVDTNAAIRDEKGNLPADYSNDGYIHLSDAGAAVLIGALNEFAMQEMSNP